MFSRENPSPEYLQLLEFSKEFHRTKKLFTGRRIFGSYRAIKRLVREHDARTLLDYGCGKGNQYEARDFFIRGVGTVPSLEEGWGVKITGYDPAHPPYAVMPPGLFDGVILQDVLEYIPESDVPWVVDEMFSKASRFVYAGVNVKMPQKKNPGKGPPRPDRPTEWWLNVFVPAGRKAPHVDWVIEIDPVDGNLGTVWRRSEPDGVVIAPEYNRPVMGGPI